MAHVIVGTAGHIDHGKSALVRALTGTDPDRLPEEKRRGITLDLGYAFLDDLAAIIDVPGHEKLVRNMVAGAATIDFALLIVAADDGIMPQTVEHLQILRLLGVKFGAIVVTKIDKVEPDWLDMICEQVRETVRGTFLETAAVHRVDSLSGRGITEFRETLKARLSKLSARNDRGLFRLPIDRVFAMKGRGTVITGTIVSGRVERDARLAILPGGRDVRVKRLETHGVESESLHAGQRAALNLIGDTEQLSRGKTLCRPDSLLESTLVRAVIECLESGQLLKDRQRVRILIGTQEVLGRVQIIGAGNARRPFVNILLEEPIVAAWGDRFILRRYSPMETLGGGRILDPQAPRLRARDMETEAELSRKLDSFEINDAFKHYILQRGTYGIGHSQVKRIFALSDDEFSDLLAANPDVMVVADYLIADNIARGLMQELHSNLADLHKKSPDNAGFARNEILSGIAAKLPSSIADYLFKTLLDQGIIEQHGALLREPQRQIQLTPDQKNLTEQIHRQLQSAGFTPPSSVALADSLKRSRSDIERALVLLERTGKCRRLGNDLFFDVRAFDNAVTTIRDALNHTDSLSVSDAAKFLNSSRKFVVPFLEYLDSQKITVREGNARIKGSR